MAKQQTQQPDTLQPHNIDAEEGLLGSLLIDSDAIMQVATFIDEKDFFIERNGWIYAAIRDLHEKGIPSDLVILSDELERRGQLMEVGGPARLTELINATPTSIHAEFYGRIIERTAMLRRLIDSAGKIARMSYEDQNNADEVYTRAIELVTGVGKRGDNDGLRHISKAIEGHTNEFDHIRTFGAQKAMSTGLVALDGTLNGGLKRGKMYAVGGRPGMGKSSLAITILLNVALQGYNVGMFSLEMKDDELVKVILSMKSGIDSRRIDTPENIEADEAMLYHKTAYDVAKLGIFIDDRPNLTMQDLRHRARLLKSTNGLDLLVVDYLQLMQGGGAKGKNRQEEVSEISRGIKTLAMELDIPIIALSQLSRQLESRADKRPMLSDLRESGSIEQDSDVVLFVYRDEMYNEDTEFPNIAEVICAKHRRGATGKANLFFKKQTTQFTDLDLTRQPLDY